MSTKSNNLVGAGVLSAIAASFCCIAPVLALISGVSGTASAFSWMDPFRPYLIAITISVLAFAWYQKLKTKNEIECECDDDLPSREGKAGKTGKSKFIQSKIFLIIISVFALSMLAFPYYSKVFYPQTAKEIIYVEKLNTEELTFSIEGMTCLGCEIHIESEVNTLKGIINVKANYKKAKTTVKYDKSVVDAKEIEAAILKTGYKIIK